MIIKCDLNVTFDSNSMPTKFYPYAIQKFKSSLFIAINANGFTKF